MPFTLDFEHTPLRDHPVEPGKKSAPAPAWWVGAKLKWEVRELDGGKVLAKTIDRPLFQRNMCFIGHPDMSGYTMQMDIRSDGNRRIMSTAGMVNQRYLILLKGNYQEIEVSSNMEVLKQTRRFRWKPHRWYRMKSRVDVLEDGSGVIRVKAWQRDQQEPEAWTFEVRTPRAHTHGSPGLYGFAPQSRFRVYIDNVSVTAND